MMLVIRVSGVWNDPTRADVFLESSDKMVSDKAWEGGEGPPASPTSIVPNGLTETCSTGAQQEKAVDAATSE